jgi:hypothetical protein
MLLVACQQIVGLKRVARFGVRGLFTIVVAQLLNIFTTPSSFGFQSPEANTHKRLLLQACGHKITLIHNQSSLPYPFVIVDII